MKDIINKDYYQCKILSTKVIIINERYYEWKLIIIIDNNY